MKRLIVSLILLATMANAGDWVQVAGGVRVSEPGPLPVVWKNQEWALKNMTDQQRYAEGWRKWVAILPAAGMQADGWQETVTASTVTREPTSVSVIPPPVAEKPPEIEVSKLVLSADATGTAAQEIDAKKLLGLMDEVVLLRAHVKKLQEGKAVVEGGAK